MTPEEFKAAGIPIPSTWHLWLDYFKRIGHTVAPDPQPYFLLITGSWDANTAMLACARQAVERARQNGWQIITGDSDGIDAEVMRTCLRLNVPFVCYGVTARPHIALGTYRYLQVADGLQARVHAMVKAADRAFIIWNGESAGAKYAHDYAIQSNVQSDIRTFGRK